MPPARPALPQRTDVRDPAGRWPGGPGGDTQCVSRGRPGLGSVYSEQEPQQGLARHTQTLGSGGAAACGRGLPPQVLAGSHMPETSSEIHRVPFPPAALPTPDMRTQTVGAALWPRHVLAWGPRGVPQSPREAHLSRTPPHAPEGGHPDPQEGASEGEDVDIHLEERKRRQGFKTHAAITQCPPRPTHTQVWKMSPDPGRCHDHAVPSGKKAASEKA